MKPNTYQRSITIVYASLAFGQVALGGLALFNRLMGNGSAADPVLTTALSIVVPFVSLMALLLAFFLFRMKRKAAASRETFDSKLAEYRVACLLRWTLLEFPAFLSLVAYFISGALLFAGLAGIMFVLFLSTIPSSSKTISDLQLNFEESEQLNIPQ
ncbi:MAG TPA: hypothetical protein VGO45_13970 [Bacteroidia bacterium]|jgi:hypothetical protein|nr:hypothetical protein [Bacteroidia bacterium]